VPFGTAQSFVSDTYFCFVVSHLRRESFALPGPTTEIESPQNSVATRCSFLRGWPNSYNRTMSSSRIRVCAIVTSLDGRAVCHGQRVIVASGASPARWPSSADAERSRREFQRKAEPYRRPGLVAS
jgi:hypothetical protein